MLEEVRREGRSAVVYKTFEIHGRKDPVASADNG